MENILLSECCTSMHDSRDKLHLWPSPFGTFLPSTSAWAAKKKVHDQFGRSSLTFNHFTNHLPPSPSTSPSASGTHNADIGHCLYGPPLNYAYLRAFDARASFTNDARLSRKFFERKWRVRVIYKWRADLGAHKWRALQNFQFCPIFKILPHFQNFDPFSNFSPIFQILTHLPNFDQFSKCSQIFKILTNFQNFN